MKTIALLILLFAASTFALDVPALEGRVNDHAGIFSADEKQQLETKLANYENASSDQIAILTIKSLEGETIEDYSMKVAEKWKIGTKKNDNGVLIIYSPSDHKIRIAVGRGLEGKLSDGRCGEIIRNEFAPRTKAKQYFAGFDSGTSAIISSIKGEYKNPSPHSTPSGAYGNTVTGKPLLFIFLLVVGFVITVCMSAAHRGLGGLSGALLGFFLPLMFWGIGTAILFGIIGLIVGLVLKDIMESSGSGGSSYSGSSGGFFSSLGSSSDSSSSGGSDYSGGGGSFDGGGASGDA